MWSSRLSRLPKVFFLAGLFILPLVFWPSASLVFEVPKVWFFSVWISTLAALTLLYFQKTDFLLNKKIVQLLLIYLTIVLVTAFIGINWQRSFLGNYFRRDGINTLFLLMALTFLVNYFWQDKWVKSLAQILTISGFLVSLITVNQAILFYLFKINLYVWEGSFGGPFGQPVFLVGYLLINLPLVIYQLFTQPKKKLTTVILMTNLLALFLTYSWTAMFGLLILAGEYFWVFGKESFSLKTFFTIGLLIILFSLYFFYNQRLFARMEVSFIAEARPRIYTKIFLGYLKKPILGWGWANVDKAFSAVDYPFKTEVDVYVDKAHSHFLEILTTAGVFGLLAYFALIFYCLKQLAVKIQQSQKELRFFYQTLLITFLFFIIHSQTNIISISEEIYFWLVLGIATKIS
jgi:O-antigen ligase